MLTGRSVTERAAINAPIRYAKGSAVLVGELASHAPYILTTDEEAFRED